MRKVISGMLLLALGITIVAITLTHTESDFVQSPIGEIKLSTELPEAPAKMPLYRVVGDESEVKKFQPLGKPRENLPSKEEAVKIAMKLINKSSNEIRLTYVKIECVKAVNGTGHVVEEHPVLVSVGFKRCIEGHPVVGPGGEIDVFLGNNGEVLAFIKIWRKLEYAGDVKVISAEEAFEKLKRGEVVNRPMEPLKIEVMQVKPGYYARGLCSSRNATVLCGYSTAEMRAHSFLVFQLVSLLTIKIFLENINLSLQSAQVYLSF